MTIIPTFVPTSLRAQIMNKKNILRIAAAVSAALLFGGAYVYFRNDIAQKETEHERICQRLSCFRILIQ